MPKAVCLQHVPFEGPGVFADALRSSGYQVECHLVPVDGLPDDPGDFLLVMGGPMSVNDAIGWVEEETTFIRHAVESGVPYLGVCLGSQFLAKAFGGKVAPGAVTEVGMTPIELTDAGRKDRAMNCLPASPHVMEWHGEGIEAPDDAVVLARSEHFPVQAFRVGERAYGLLFHLELTKAGLSKLCEECPADLENADRTAPEVLSEASGHLENMQRMAAKMITRICDGT